MKGLFSLMFATLATYISTTAVNAEKRASPLSVVLTALGNSEVKVAVTNNDNKGYNLLSKGTFLDEQNPVEKVSVFSASGGKYFGNSPDSLVCHCCNIKTNIPGSC